ncbi:aspartic proteinase CDR1-like [Impatiens glandulifera]|uniref:aspartic proteinase CDR1-like n=1 Tax=Impatiens glandulifera TaxID=253017 RepID=UPI001FB152C6|nr:aspartic proteinase CDR1-like [Impatiens glandulifera]
MSHSRSRLSYLKSILKLPNNHAAETTAIRSTITVVPSAYLMEIYVGTPPVKQMMELDTGSDLSWTQCHPCVNCFEQNQPIFNSDQSSSYQVLRSCYSSDCLKLRRHIDCTRSNEKCKYRISYGNGLRSKGELAKETYTVGGTSIENILHGCGHENIRVFDKQSSGVIGLGDSPLSFFGQIRNSIGGMFSYCLVPEFGSNPNARSMISFGNNEIVYGRGMMSTTLFRRLYNAYYFLKLESISVGRYRTIQMITQSITQPGNILIDTSALLSYLPSVVLENLKEALIQEIGKRPLNVSDGFCYESNTYIPTITFHFADGADLALSKMNIFISNRNMLCLAIEEDDDDHYLPIFGNLPQMNFLIIYNIPGRKVYFKPTDCSRHIITT